MCRKGLDRSALGLRGAVSVELSLVLMPLFLVVVAITDVTRYLAVVAILNKGAADGLRVAVKSPYMRAEALPSAAAARSAVLPAGVPEADAGFRVYVRTREEVIRRALEFPLATLLAPSMRPGGATLLPFFVPNGAQGGAYHDGLLLRPGETFYEHLHPAQSRYFVPHPTLPGLAAIPPLPRLEVLKMERLLFCDPIAVVLRARVNTTLFGALIAEGSAVGFYDLLPHGVEPIEIPSCRHGDDGAI